VPAIASLSVAKIFAHQFTLEEKMAATISVGAGRRKLGIIP